MPPPSSRERVWSPPTPLDLWLTLSVHRRGHGDPAFQVTPDGAIWRTCHTPQGPGTLRVAARACEGVVHAVAYGPGATWLLDHLPALLGADDDPAALQPRHPAVRAAAARLRGLRIGRTGRVFEALVPAVLEQKVVGSEAKRAWRILLTRFGEPAPGPAPEGMRVIPPPEVWARLPSWEWHRAGAEGIRGATIASAARVAARLEGASSAETDRRLRTLPGIGPWTSAEVRQRSHGDPDAVSVGDYHLPSLVGWALVGRRLDDAGMLEALAPYVGQRYRVSRLVTLAGPRPARRGPRRPPRDYRRI